MKFRLSRFRNLPLFWKLLVPFLTLMVIVGAFGVFLIVRDLSSGARAALHNELARRALEARASLHERELYLLESANFAANLEGMVGAVSSRDAVRVERLLQSVLALKTDLNLAAITDQQGTGLVEFSRTSAGDDPSFGRDTPWSDNAFVKEALTDPQGGKRAGMLQVGEQVMLGIAAPVCSTADGCGQVGAAIAGVRVDLLATAARGKTPSGPTPAYETGVSIYDLAGRLLTTAGAAASEPSLPAAAKREGSTTREDNSRDLLTMYSPFEVQGQRAGTVAVSIPTAAAISSVRGAGFGLSLIVLAAMAGVVGVGAILSRFILAQVRPLVETNRALGRGELSARAPVMGADELGELAQGVNQMAEQLQASYETLELRVAQRTEEVQRLLSERTEFFVGLSHELRTPLAIIRNRIKLLRDPSFRKDARWMRETEIVMDESTQQLLSLVNDVLELARAETVGLEMNLEKWTVAELVKEVEPTLRGLAGASSLDLEIRVPRQLPPVRADRARAREVLLNLVDNAVKYSPEGGKVRVSALAENGTVGISVSDSGVGIPAAVGDLIFEPFYRVEGTKVQHGNVSSGLGLAVAKRLVEAQGGEIGYKANEQGGTTFSFTLPPAKSQSPNGRSAR